MYLVLHGETNSNDDIIGVMIDDVQCSVSVDDVLQRANDMQSKSNVNNITDMNTLFDGKEKERLIYPTVIKEYYQKIRPHILRNKSMRAAPYEKPNSTKTVQQSTQNDAIHHATAFGEVEDCARALKYPNYLKHPRTILCLHSNICENDRKREFVKEIIAMISKTPKQMLPKSINKHHLNQTGILDRYLPINMLNGSLKAKAKKAPKPDPKFDDVKYPFLDYLNTPVICRPPDIIVMCKSADDGSTCPFRSAHKPVLIKAEASKMCIQTRLESFDESSKDAQEINSANVLLTKLDSDVKEYFASEHGKDTDVVMVLNARM
ncbi:hypothetical protein V5799_032440 [Amblyomma americanum]|uniref:Uncharacterized protein n=1 Tax=Amblyomma americanum TaxID=6943 RepID=A0AAQ4DR60_AMBAM